MQVIISSLLIIATIAAVLITPLLYYHKQTIACWTTFIAVVLFALAGCLQWQKHILEVQAQVAVPHSATNEQPELYISGAMMMPLEAGKPETVLLGLKNRGKAIARNIRLGGGNHVFTTRNFAGPLVYKPVPFQSRPDLGPGKEENSLISKSPQPLSQKQIEELTNEEALFFHFAEGEYDDDAGNTYPIDYCYMFNPLSPTILKMCPEKYWPKSRADRRGTPSLDAAPAASLKREPAQPVPDPKTLPPRMGSGSGARPGGYPRPHDTFTWTDYTEDYFYDAIWRWDYIPAMSDTPRNIRGFCPECRDRLMNIHRRAVEKDGTAYAPFSCSNHPFKAYYVVSDSESDSYDGIRTMIQQKLRSGSWREVVKRQRSP
jgi:hypothetical protein